MDPGQEERWLPSDLEQRLRAFKTHLRKLKASEAVSLALVALVVSFALTFIVDRWIDTPRAVRMGLLLAGLGVLGWQALSWWWRWVRRSRSLTDVARVVGRAQPMVGDHLLGVVELAQRGRDGQSSEALAKAAIAQVAEEMRGVDWNRCVPEPRHVPRRRWATGALVFAALLAVVPGAGLNALQRWATPWRDVERFTFAQLDGFAARQVVALGESFELVFQLHEDTDWSPASARLQLPRGRDLSAENVDGTYRFDVPPLAELSELRVRVGDARESVEIVPLARPELAELGAAVELPSYLQRDAQQRDARSGSLTVVEGSSVAFTAKVTRALAEATWNGSTDGVRVDGDTLHLRAVLAEGDSQHALEWRDVEGLEARQPFVIEMHAREDRAPDLFVRGLSQDQVVLDEEAISFQVDAADDFGLRHVGMEWRGLPRDDGSEPVAGETLVAMGLPTAERIATDAVFCAKNLGIEPQPIELRLYTEDYRPDGERVYTQPYRLYVLGAEEHMMWLTEQLRRWNQDVLEVRDEEERLHARNQELRGWPADALGTPEGRRELARQAAGERANGRRLDGLAMRGEQILQQAMRNSEFNAQTLEALAKALQSLKDLANNRMPSVSRGLAEASQAPEQSSPPPNAPSVGDTEQGATRDQQAMAEASPPSESKGRLGLPTTTLTGPPNPGEGGECPPPGESPLDPPLDEQAALLAEFHKVMDEIGEILSNLHASTFVKRLKHVAKEERRIGTRMHERLVSSFGSAQERLGEGQRSLLDVLADQQRETAQFLEDVEDDLAAYFERTREVKFDNVRREMRDQRVVPILEEMGDAIVANLGGEIVAEVDYWSDELDRWAEMLVGPG